MIRKFTGPALTLALAALIGLFATVDAHATGKARVEWYRGQGIPTVLGGETLSSSGTSIASSAAPSFSGGAGTARVVGVSGAVIVYCCSPSPTALQTNGIRLEPGQAFTFTGIPDGGLKIAIIEATDPAGTGGGGGGGGATPAGTNTIGDVGSASFSATCTTLTNPGTGGTYASGDLVANSATAGSVTPLTCTVARYSGGPVTITKARILTSTTGVSNAQFRVHAYTGTPTVTNGNDGVFLSTAAGHFCRLDVTVDFAFSDGADGSGVPVAGTSCTRQLSGTADIKVLLEARAAYAWTAAQTYTVVLEGFN